jgi:hypothetical protein
VVPLKGGTNKINAACHPQACFFSVFYPKLAQRRTIKVWSRVKVSGLIIRAVLLTQSGFNGKILNRIVMLSSTGHLLKKYLVIR